MKENNYITGLIDGVIKSTLGEQAKYFKINHFEVIEDDDDYHASLFSIEPIKIVTDGVESDGKDCIIQFDIDKSDNSICMIWGEDSEHPVTTENIFKYLYWNEITG